MKQDAFAKFLLQKNFRPEEVVAIIATLSIPSVDGVELEDGGYLYRNRHGGGYHVQAPDGSERLWKVYRVSTRPPLETEW